ncbi:MAG TPA: hypothetical protein VJ717_09595 [Gemmatimonadaceae bacterium]|nr:hypothetical protein [Gemmatimonadaceae bacterium]
MRNNWQCVMSLIGTSVVALGMHTLSINPTVVIGGQSAEATLRLAQDAASGPSVYTVQVSDTSIASAPATVSVPAGSTITSFKVTTRPVSVLRTVTVTVADASATLKVRPPVLIKLVASPDTVRRGETVKGSVVIDGPAPNAGSVVKVMVTSKSGTQPPGVTFPPAVVIPAGQTTVSFIITVDRSASAGTLTVTAILGNVSLKQDFTAL